MSWAGLSACESTPTPPATEQAVGIPVDAPKVSVLNSGSGEKIPLRYQDLDEDARPLTVDVTQGFDQRIVRADRLDPRAPKDAHADQVRLPLNISTHAPAEKEGSTDRAEATRAVEARLTGAPQSSDIDRNEDLRGAEGFRYGWRAEDQGRISEIQVAAPHNSSEEARGYIESAFKTLTAYQVVFPEEPVGVGAQWTVESRVAMENSYLQTATYTVTSLSENAVTLSVTVEQRPTLGALHDGDHTLTVLGTQTSSEGELTLDLHSALPRSGSLRATTRVVYGEQSSDVRVVQDLTSSVRYTPASDDAAGS